MKSQTPAYERALRPTSPGLGARLRSFGRRLWQDRVSYVMVAPYVICFTIFILLPVLGAIGLSFTFYNMIETPRFVGLLNYIYLFTEDDVFMTHVCPIPLRLP